MSDRIEMRQDLHPSVFLKREKYKWNKLNRSLSSLSLNVLMQ